MPTLHLLCGLPCSGKTTLARRLESERCAVRFTLDEWMLALFDLTPYDAEYGDRAERVRELIWTTVSRVLALGRDVVLDWSHWSRPARARAAERATRLGADAVLHYLDVPLEVAVARAERRNASPDGPVHVIDIDDLRRFASELFEPPSPNEPLLIVAGE